MIVSEAAEIKRGSVNLFKKTKDTEVKKYHESTLFLCAHVIVHF